MFDARLAEQPFGEVGAFAMREHPTGEAAAENARDHVQVEVVPPLRPRSYTPAEMVASDRRVVFGEFDPEDVCTSHVERQNLNTRLFVKRFNRLTLYFSKKLENLKAAVALYVAYHNFCWRPRFPGNRGRRRLTPAMAAGIVPGLWSFADLIDAVSAY